jgi:hypothetical protein
MNLTLTTPALLFPAISLLLLAYTNRYLTLCTLVRNLKERHDKQADHISKRQIQSVVRRLNYIRNMQWLGAASFFFCVLCMLLLFLNLFFAAKIIFVFALLLLLASLVYSILEIRLSNTAIKLEIQDLEVDVRK